MNTYLHINKRKEGQCSINLNLFIPMDRMAEYCRANGIARLAIFGSALRADFGPDSDIDLLVDFEPDRRISLFDMAGMEQEFSEILGRKVDLIERSGVERSRNYIRRAEILGTAETIYAA